MPTPKTIALKAKLNPVAKAAAGFRKNVGDTQFPAVADQMIKNVRQNRMSRNTDISMGY